MHLPGPAVEDVVLQNKFALCPVKGNEANFPFLHLKPSTI